MTPVIRKVKMETKLQQIRNEMKKKNIKRTKQREQILRLFLMPGHNLFTAAQIHQQLAQTAQKINPSTIYRNLDILTTAGLIRQISLNDGISRYELITDHHHHHLICLSCGETSVFELCPFQEINEFINRNTDFKPVEHRFEIYGYCHSCQSKQH